MTSPLRGVLVAAVLGAQPASPTEDIREGDLLRVTADTAALRSGCAPDADIRVILPRTTRLQVIGTTAHWYSARVFETGQEGCVAAEAVEFLERESHSREPSAAPLPSPEPDGQAALPQPRPRQAVRERPVKLFVTGSGAADTNINHTPENLRSYGVVVGGGLRYRNRPNDPSVRLTYEAALHQYTATTIWDRLSHYARADWEGEFGDRWQL